MKHLILTTFGALLVFASCTKESTDQPDSISANNQIKINSPQVGQVTRFVRFKADPCAQNASVTYVNDTIVVKVIDVQPTEITMLEQYTPNSASVLNPPSFPDSHPYGKTDGVKILAKVENNALVITKLADPNAPSRIFPRLPISFNQSKNTDGVRSLSNWFVKKDVVAQGVLNNYIQRGKTYSVLNVFSDYPTSGTDGLSYFQFYDPQGGFVRSAFLFGTCLESGGWDALED